MKICCLTLEHGCMFFAVNPGCYCVKRNRNGQDETQNDLSHVASRRNLSQMTIATQEAMLRLFFIPYVGKQSMPEHSDSTFTSK